MTVKIKAGTFVFIMTSTIQANIKRQLAEKNMTAAELERRTGIPHAVINILHGRSKNPSIRTAQAIAKELGCSIDELFIDPIILNHQTIPQNSWVPELYLQAFNAVYQHIENSKLKPSAMLVSNCITEIYDYSIGSPDRKVDQRFVQWLVDKNLNI